MSVVGFLGLLVSKILLTKMGEQVGEMGNTVNYLDSLSLSYVGLKTLHEELHCNVYNKIFFQFRPLENISQSIDITNLRANFKTYFSIQ